MEAWTSSLKMPSEEEEAAWGRRVSRSGYIRGVNLPWRVSYSYTYLKLDQFFIAVVEVKL